MSNYMKSPTGTAHDFANITPADADLARPARGLHVGTGGTVVATSENGTVATWTVPDGGYVLGVIVRVAAASTASNIVALYD